MTTASPPPPPRPQRPAAPARSVGDTLFGWTQQPATAAVFAVGLGMTLAALVALEALVPRQGAGSVLDGRLGAYAALGAVGAALAFGAAFVLRRIPGLRDEAGDADQP
ncbi:MAG: hypothetical protein KJS97_08560 [Alphaproteobacteria bacterium]|nr:hypothetical protein [Alphaproteobacteria bacterium]